MLLQIGGSGFPPQGTAPLAPSGRATFHDQRGSASTQKNLPSVHIKGHGGLIDDCPVTTLFHERW